MSVELRRAFGHFATGVTVVTTLDARGRRVGMTANSFASLSLEPPLVLWSLANSSTNHAAFLAARYFAIHVLAAGQDALARQFASRAGDRFAGVAVESGCRGVPLLADFHARFECEMHAQHEGGDHTIFVGRVLRVAERPGEPLLFHRGRYAGVAPAEPR